MSKLEECLNKLFIYERSVSEPYARMQDVFRKTSNQYTNVELVSEDLGIEGIAQHYHTESQGAVIYEYSVDREIRKTGRKLEAPLDMLMDCEHHYYGLKLNCLGYLSGQRIKSLILRDSYNGVSIPIRYNPTIAQLFLSNLTRQKESLQPDSVRNQQFTMSFK